MTIKPFSPDNISALFSHLEGCDKGFDTLHISGCTGSGDAFLICHLFQKYNRPLLTVVPDSKKADTLARECSFIVGEENVALCPSRDAIPYNMRSPFGPTTEKRFRVLSQLMNSCKLIYITTSATLLQKIPPQKELFNHIITLHINDEISQEKLASWLTDNGFSRETIVEDIGSFAIRGGIVDIYPFLTENPIRLEFWGDTIESVREFDIFTQKSLKTCTEINIYPMKEFCPQDSQIEQALQKIEAFCKQNNEDSNHVYKLRRLWKSQTDLEGIEWFQHWFDLPFATLCDYLSADCLVVWNDFFSPRQRLEVDYSKYKHHLNRVPDTIAPFVSKPETLLVSISQLQADLSTYSCVYFNTNVPSNQDTSSNLAYQEQPAFNSNIKILISDLQEKEAFGYEITIFCESEGLAQRLLGLLENDCPTVSIVVGYIAHGFIDTVNTIAYYSENQIFSRTRRATRTKKIKRSVPISSFDSLLPNDFVVHIEHGIARFSGIERILALGNQQDCMVLAYQNRAKVYVPVEDFYKVQKYIGRDSSAPTLSKLGTVRWEKQKAKARESLRQMAEGLVSLYAKRTCLEGIAFSHDSVWQKEFEDSFIFDPTPDQSTADKDVKKDMESLKPMDRLICGDVGFGKTEIAMRAAVKAALDGYQVALLAPTTILAAQHFTTFTERMANLPVTVAVLSRFLTTKEQKEILKKLNSGAADIIIGTHRILSKDVVFKNLGLLIVDEEQRFGVRHKEKLKEYRYKVDVLSMTATPIPRTLHMSLVGIRDLSLINTPPRNRLPIETHVLEYHEEIIKNAIEAELERGGQVYVVHNRIKSIPLLLDTLESAVPNARIVVAHGQMDEKYLEQVMKEFIAGKFDVLLSTAIIENGLDIPNVNTIIVDRADMLGLSQLYQLRGRVGRSAEQAFAYFLTAPFKEAKETSLKRLRALEQYTDLGSGFQIAMRDLEIRGAGNILGTDQHGTIAAIGFDLYCRLLKEEIDVLMGNESENNKKEVKIDLPVDAYIPAQYIADSATRIALYQECSACKHLDDIREIEKDFIDRFGPQPEPVQALVSLIRMKILAQTISLSHISIQSENLLLLSFHGTDDEIAHQIKRFISTSKRTFEVAYGTPIVLKTELTAKTSLGKTVEINNLLGLQ